MTSVYDFRATALVNLCADRAINMRNRLLQEDSTALIDMRRILLWSAQDVAPRAAESVHGQIAYEASIVIQHALALDRMVPALWARAS